MVIQLPGEVSLSRRTDESPYPPEVETLNIFILTLLIASHPHTDHINRNGYHH
jgi:hypothetical protein